MENNQNVKLVLIKDLGMSYPKENSKNKIRYGKYKCYCGIEFKAHTRDVKSGRTKSCGCLRGTNHNLSRHTLYQTWKNMLDRCTNSKNKSYQWYGERGITVCDRWLDVKNFIEDMYPTYIEGLTIDRIDNNGGYNKNNCRWTTIIIQKRNTRLLRSDNTSGYRGVMLEKRSNKFVARIMVNSKQIHLGLFITAIDGAKAYDNYIISNGLEHTRNFS